MDATTTTTSAECRCPMTIERVGPDGIVEVYVTTVEHDADCLVGVLAATGADEGSTDERCASS